MLACRLVVERSIVSPLSPASLPAGQLSQLSHLRCFKKKPLFGNFWLTLIETRNDKRLES
ncbi:MAG: hypothetical protein ACI87E_005132 [Mariniblastus sp.]|jgi:hypothetical protein